jgi:hypothetical protein
MEEIEAIKRVKYRYFRCFDTANVAAIADVFTEDVVITVLGGVYKFELQGRDAYLEVDPRGGTRGDGDAAPRPPPRNRPDRATRRRRASGT